MPLAVAKMPEDTLTPFLMAVTLTVLFAALLLKAITLALVAVIASLFVAGVWLWPEPEREVAACASSPNPRFGRRRCGCRTA